MKMPDISWPTAIVLVAAQLSIVAAYVASAEDQRAAILAALGSLFTIAASLARSLFPGDRR